MKRNLNSLRAVIVCVPLVFGALAGWPQATVRSGVPLSPEARLDLNRATLDELLKVPGMTSSWAGRIVRFRPYRTKADLLKRGVVTSTVYNRIKDYVIAHREKQ